MSELTQDGDGGGELSVPEERLAVDLCVRVVGVGVARGSLHSRPLSDGAVPSHDAVQNTGMILGKQPEGRERGSKQSYGFISRSDMKFGQTRLKQVEFIQERRQTNCPCRRNENSNQ